MTLPTTCSHGKRWDEECAECSSFSMCQNMRWLIQDCERVSKYLSEKPAMASDPSVVIDLYDTVARLAKILCSAQPQSGDGA